MRPNAPRMAVVAAVIGGLTLTLGALPPAVGQDLEGRRDAVLRQLDRNEAELDQSSAQLVEATAGLRSAQTSLSGARVRLAQTRGELTAAQAFDEQMQDELESAVQELQRARGELVRGRAAMSDQEELLATIVVRNYETGDPALLALSMVLNSQDTAELTSQLNSVNSVLDKESATLDGLEASRVLLTMQEENLQEAEREVARRRTAAAENLEHKVLLEARAVTDQARIEDLVTARSVARSTAVEAKARDLRDLDELESERQRISALLERRAVAARQRAEEARRQAEEAAAARVRAREAARESARARSQRETAAPHRRDRSPDRATPHVPAQPAPPTPSPGLLQPVDGYVSSMYGLRFHPVYKRWSLHDGTDIAAGCGTPIRAAASGTVIAVYYNSSYGNRVIMDHGYTRGVGLGTSYNHLSAYSTYVGQRVQRGDIVGYVGTTGASTGCHLHFMVFEDGQTVDPMRWL